MPTKRTPQYILDAAVNGYVHDGMTMEVLANQFGVNSGTISRELARRGIKARPRVGTPRISLARYDGAVSTYMGGVSAHGAANAFGFSKKSLLRELDRRGIRRRSSTETLKLTGNTRSVETPQIERDRMVEAYLGGKTMAQAAALFGKATIVCHEELKRRGIERRQRKTPKNVLDEMVAAYLEGKSAFDAAAMFDGSEATCYAALKERGIALRPKEERYRMGGRRISATRQGISVDEWSGYAQSDWHRVNATQEWKDWRKAVFARDNFTCADCGKRGGGNLHPHHIFQKAKFPHLIFEVGNGVTLCKKCHDSIRRKEEALAARYLTKIGSTIAPLVFFDSWPDRSANGRRQIPKQLNLW